MILEIFDEADYKICDDKQFRCMFVWLPIARWGDGSCPEPRQGSRSGGWRRERATGWVLPGPKRQQCPTAPTISPAVKRRWKEFMETGASRQPWQVSVLGYAMLCRMPCSDQSTESRYSSSARAATQRPWRDGVVKLLCVCYLIYASCSSFWILSAQSECLSLRPLETWLLLLCCFQGSEHVR